MRAMTAEDRRKQFDARCERLNKMLDMHMPPAIISLFTLPVMENIHGGKWNFLWWHFKQVLSDRWNWHKGTLWFFWQRKVLRRSENEISALIDKGFGLEPEDEAA